MRRLAIILLVSAGPLAAADRPNVLFVYCDDVRWDALGVVQREQGERARFPWLKTPHLDRLAAEGTRFRNAFVVNALCAPSRASFLTGLYGHANGIVNNHTPFAAQPSWATALKSAGYTTGYVGKFHMGPQSGQRPGFDFSASFVGQGRYVDCPVEVDGKATPTTGWVDDVSTDFALDFLKMNAGKPFALAVGYKSSHGPFQPPPRHAETYAGEQARPVPNLGVKAIYRDDPPGPRATNLGYFRCVTAVDDNVGRLLAALDDLKIADNTLVIYASDNGFYLGEHGLGDKRSAYDESLRIPLLVRGPGVGRGKVEDRMALNVDLAATLCDYAGVANPPRTHGASWRPLLEGKPADWRSAWFYCYFYENNFAIPTTTCVRTDSAKLIKYPGRDDWTEVFDLKADPYETKNLAAVPAAADLRRRLEAEYDRQAKLVDFRVPDSADRPANDRPRDGLKAWVLDYRFDADDGDKVTDASASKNHGAAKGAPLADGRDGGKARRFDGKGYLEVPKSKSLDPSVLGWTVEATLHAEKPDGVLVARGGRVAGYCLYLEGGKPMFAVTSRQRTSTVRAPAAVSGWATVTARVTADKRLTLAVDGKPVASAALHEFLTRDPSDGMQLGTDLGSAVVEPKPPNFTGRIAAVRVYSGVDS